MMLRAISLATLAYLSVTTQAFVVTGATGGINARTGARPLRQNVITMQRAGGPAWDLYIQALQKFQSTDQSNALSWYEFNGIHGFPAVDWDNVPATSDPETPGYAYHSSILFGPWHRVFLAAYEQVIQEHAKEIASQYPRASRNRYVAAAVTLRVPYWDWASHASMPTVMNQQSLWINTAKGIQSLVNPLSAYTFHPVPGASDFPQDFPLSAAPHTERTPDDTGTPQIQAANAALQANGDSLTDKVYYLISRQTDYAPFSNTSFPADLRNGSYDSLESIHNQVHGLVGGDGHMAYIPFSSFDPIFWLHHANIDRLFAIWSAINPSSYVVPQENSVGTYAQASGTTEDEDSPLYPFRKDNQGNFHTAATARNTSTFGYSYPEIVDWSLSDQQLASKVRRVFKQLYNPTGVLDNQKRTWGLTILRHADSTSNNRAWFINMSVNRTLSYPFAINFFLGTPPDSYADWPTASNLVASQIVLPDLTASKIEAPAFAQIPLTRFLAAAQGSSLLNATDSSSVKSFLAEQLHWTATTSTGTMIEPNSLTGLQITILDQTVQTSGVAADEFSIFGTLNNNAQLSWTSANGTST